MLADIHPFGKEIPLIMNSGIQFIDFGLTIDWKDKKWKEKNTGYFLASSNNDPIRRLVLDRSGSGYSDPALPGKIITNPVDFSVEESLKLFNGIWLPIPILRSMPPNRFDNGPFNWARARIVELAQPDEDGHTHRVILAIDTKIFSHSSDTAYLGPMEDDIRAGSVFTYAYQSNHISWFLDLKWVKDWFAELFRELAPEPDRLKIYEDDIEEELKNHSHEAHYLNLLALIGEELNIPNFKIIAHNRSDVNQGIAVDLILDVGNSRSCGILVEDHAQEQDSLKKRYELSIRDLSMPEFAYSEPFESRVEFAQAFFGKEHYSVQSGRRDAFQWPSIVRVGKEASRLASRRKGNEGSTGLSSPKRYLWDLTPYEQAWRFNSSYVESDNEPFATAAPLSGYINGQGEALYELSDDIDEEFERKMPVFQPHYSRGSLMTFLLSEVLLHALMQINSPAQRAKLEHAKSPRFLRSIILTVPPAMPSPEINNFKNCMHQAIGLTWKMMGWDKTDDPVDFAYRFDEKYWPTLPEVIVQWDEATASQVVYLFNETQINYGGRAEKFISDMVRPDKTSNKNAVTIATVDIGGGTTDLVITDFTLDYGNEEEDGLPQSYGTNVFIKPIQRFRDGFKVAGDDILLDIIRDVVVESLKKYLISEGIKNYDSLLSDLIGSGADSVQIRLLRQQLTLQIFRPIGLKVLQAYEQYDPLERKNKLMGATFGSVLEGFEPPTQKVLDFVNIPISRELGKDFNILDIPLQVNLLQIHNNFLQGHYDICKTFQSLCEIIYFYQCDVLLLTGRPSLLPGVQAYFKNQLPLPSNRILPLHGYKTGNWYPFHKQGRIDDPKTTATVGAMLCFLSKNSRIPSFYFRSMALKPYSTIKNLGLIDNNNTISKENVYYSDINLDKEDYELPDQSFPIRGKTRIGFRQLNTERWAASPLYTITIESNELRNQIAEGQTVNVTLKLDKKNRHNKQVENFVIDQAFLSSGRKTNGLKMTLNTLLDSGLNDSQYWLDSGSLINE